MRSCTIVVARTTASSDALYAWAEKAPYARPFVEDPTHRSLVVGTVELDAGIDKDELRRILSENGVVDLDAYRGALLVVSHDFGFLERIGIDTVIELDDAGRMRRRRDLDGPAVPL